MAVWKGNSDIMRELELLAYNYIAKCPHNCQLEFIATQPFTLCDCSSTLEVDTLRLVNRSSYVTQCSTDKKLSVSVLKYSKLIHSIGVGREISREFQ